MTRQIGDLRTGLTFIQFHAWQSNARAVDACRLCTGPCHFAGRAEQSLAPCQFRIAPELVGRRRAVGFPCPFQGPTRDLVSLFRGSLYKPQRATSDQRPGSQLVRLKPQARPPPVEVDFATTPCRVKAGAREHIRNKKSSSKIGKCSKFSLSRKTSHVFARTAGLVGAAHADDRHSALAVSSFSCMMHQDNRTCNELQNQRPRRES